MSKIFDENLLPKATDYDSSLSDNKLSKEFDATILQLEGEREKFYKKTKGLFKRVYFRTVLVCSISFIVIGGFVNDWKYTPSSIIGPIMISFVVALIFGGIYTLVRKGTNNHKFTRILKENLVSKLVSHVNPELTYSIEGIKKEEFHKADLFVGGPKSTVRSEDKIFGTINGKYVCISECKNQGRAAATQGQTKITQEKAHTDLNMGEFVDYFRGLFIEIELEGYHLTTPLKFVPRENKKVENGISFEGYVQKFINVDSDDLIDLKSDREYQAYCSDKAQAESVISERLLKIVDYIFFKYNKEGASIFENVAILNILPGIKDHKISKNVYLSIVGGRLYLALEWPVDLFETDVFLKKNLVESGIAQKIYEDLLFINRLIKEVNLLNA